jgi:hypothetical protein
MGVHRERCRKSKKEPGVDILSLGHNIGRKGLQADLAAFCRDVSHRNSGILLRAQRDLQLSKYAYEPSNLTLPQLLTKFFLHPSPHSLVVNAFGCLPPQKTGHLGPIMSPSSMNTMGGGDLPGLWLVGFEEI